jgi:hypothetical protein
MKRILALMFLLTSFFSSWAMAWSQMGHEIIGAIADEMLTPDAKNMVRGILGIEPLYVAAIWPDLVRDDARFGTRTIPGDENSASHDFSPFHFCVAPVGYTYLNKPVAVEKDCHGVVTKSLFVLKDPNLNRETKMIALRYIVHVIGDLHQPLHIDNGYDRGANSCQVNVLKDTAGKPVRQNLHSYWDDNIVAALLESYKAPGAKYPPRYVPDVIKYLKANKADYLTAGALQKFAAGTPADWITESQGVRDAGVYPDADMQSVPKGEEYKNRPYCLWYVNQDADKNPAPGSQIIDAKVPTLGADYNAKMTPVAELQLVKAGLRLAATLNQLAVEVKNQPGTLSFEDAAEKSVFELLLQKLKNTF